MRSRIVENSVQGDAGKIGELHFHNGRMPRARADGRAHHGVFADRSYLRRAREILSPPFSAP